MTKTMDKEALLGSVTTEEGEHSEAQPDLDLLHTFEKDTSVIGAFCNHCGTYHELAFPEAEKIFMTLNQSLDFEGKYLIFSSCSLCKFEDKTVELKHF